MKKTLYISDEAMKILSAKQNMSRYVSDLIIADSKKTNNINLQDIMDIIQKISNGIPVTSSNKDEMLKNMQDILNM